MATVDSDEVLLLWRSVSAYRSGVRPACQPRGPGRRSDCPLYARCPHWSQPEDRRLVFEESFSDTDRRRASWPCSRLLEALGPETSRIGS